MLHKFHNYKKIIRGLGNILIITSILTFILAYYFTKNFLSSLMITLPELFILSICYFQRYSSSTPYVIWITGLPASGKTTIGKALKEELEKKSYKVEHLDGDKIRELLPETGFSRSERNLHIKRTALLASTLQKHNIFVIVSLISPYKESREFARNICGNFIEVYLSTPIEVCEQRDPKKLYEKAKRGELKNFTGVNDPYEKPDHPELTLDTSKLTVKESVKKILKKISI